MEPQFGKMLLIAGAVLIVAGLIFTFGPHIPWIGKLPGDITIRRENFSFYFPLTTSILLSVVLSLIFYFFRR